VVVVADVRPEHAPVLVAFDAPVRQRRTTVAARFGLALPHILALGAAAPAVIVVSVIGWCGALAGGRLPRPVAAILAGYIGWQARLLSYLVVLTDAYPPFSLADVHYPVRVTTRPGRLNRWAVAFRLVLALPALVVAATVTLGIATPVLVVAWSTAVVTGRLPSSLHQAFAAAVRYETRLVGYLTMVTSEYPWGLLGDPDPAPTTPDTATGTGTAFLWQPDPPSPTRDPYWRLVLSAPAKNTVVLLLVLGVAIVATVNVATAVVRYDRFHTDELAGTRVQSAYASLSGAVVRYEGETRSCQSAVQPLPCLTGAAQSVSEAFTVFVGRLSATTMPASVSAARAVVVTDGTRAGEDFARLSASTSAGHYELTIDTSNLPELLSRFDQDYVELGTQLTNLD